MVRVHQRVASMRIADAVVVATDDDEIRLACAAHGIRAVMTRQDHPSGTDRVAEVAARTEFQEMDVVLNVQGDEPFVTYEALAGAVSIVKSGAAPIGTAAVPIGLEALQRPDVVKVVCTDGGLALYFSRAPIPFLRDASDAPVLEPLVHQHVGVYAYTRHALQQWVAWTPHPLELVERLEQLRPLAHGLAIGVARVPVAEGGIDTEDDLQRANSRWAAYSAQHHAPDTNDSTITP